MSMMAIKTEKLCKSYWNGEHENQVIKEIDLEVNDQEFVSIMGPSGCGKSTLLYILGTLDKPTQGKVFLYGKDYSRVKSRELSRVKRQDIGFIFQFYNLVPNLSVEDNILLPLLIDRKNVKEYKERLDEILAFTGIKDKAKNTPNELSGGEQQRVAIARALITNPRILFADEPIGNLDTKTGEKIMRLFVRINKEYKTTIIQVTHSRESAEYGHTIIKILDGVIQDRVDIKKQIV